MDRLKIKKKLYAGMGDFAKQKRGEELRKKYAAAPPAMAKQMESEDAAVDAAALPKAGALDMSGADVSDVNSGSEENKLAIDEAMGAIAEDEEMAKWMAKQR